jgi:hypothetical protein
LLKRNLIDYYDEETITSINIAKGSLLASFKIAVIKTADAPFDSL